MKLYQYVKILYVQPNCSMSPCVLRLCAPSVLQDRDADRSVQAWPCSLTSETLVREDPSDCVLGSSGRL